MRIILDARALRMYPVGMATDGLVGGSETMVREIAKRLTKWHTVHVVTNDLDEEQQRGEHEWWWPPNGHPTVADVVVMVHSLEFVADYQADYLVYMVNGVDPDLGPGHAYASGIDAFPVFSAKHGELMRQFRPTVPEDKCFVTGLGVNIDEYNPCPDGPDCEDILDVLSVYKEPGRLFWANDPARGLWHMLDIFDALKPLVPEATLHIGYDFDRQFEHHRWAANALAEELWECKRRLSATDGVVNLGALSRAAVVEQQLQCQVHAMASDPPNVGSQIHGLTAGECAAAGAALVLSDTEALPEVFGECATILPLPGTYMAQHERRYDAKDWAEVIAEIMHDEAKVAEMSERSRKWAEHNTWDHVVGRWQKMLGIMSGQVAPRFSEANGTDGADGNSERTSQCV